MDPSQEIAEERPPFVRIYKDGRVERFMPPDLVPTGVDPETGVDTKDVVISPETGVSVRLFLPPVPNPPPPNQKKFPILVHFHGGGFCAGSAFSRVAHNFLVSLSAQAGVLAVSVEYRLAPEHPIPTGYLDSWAAVQWVARQATAGPGAEPWLAEHGDFDRFFFIGESSGGNFAHHMAMAASGVPAFASVPKEDEVPVKLVGLIPVHAVFTEANAAEDDHWQFVCPATRLPDDPLINIVAASSPDLGKLVCRRVLVCVAEKDHLKGRGLLYHDTLKKSGWNGELELEETEGEGHCFFLFNNKTQKAKDLMDRIVSFINRIDPHE